jgi:putative phosphoserine phosphatase / 1-acylglycerol-3-phosphate O-acyltransferase
MRSCAIFDVDGTLLKGFIIQSFPRYLSDQGVIDPRLSERIDGIVQAYGRGVLDYRHIAEKVPPIYAEAIKGVNVTTIKTCAEEYMKDHVTTSIHPYTYNLVEAMRENVDIVIALSGSPDEPIQYMKKLGFQYAYGSIFDVQDGVYTGKINWNLILGEEKAEYVEILAERLGFSLDRTVGFGDSEQDAQILHLTGLPIALNPSYAMQKICGKMGWRKYTTETISISEIVECVAGL